MLTCSSRMALTANANGAPVNSASERARASVVSSVSMQCAGSSSPPPAARFALRLQVDHPGAELLAQRQLQPLLIQTLRQHRRQPGGAFKDAVVPATSRTRRQACSISARRLSGPVSFSSIIGLDER